MSKTNTTNTAADEQSQRPLIDTGSVVLGIVALGVTFVCIDGLQRYLNADRIVREQAYFQGVREEFEKNERDFNELYDAGNLPEALKFCDNWRYNFPIGSEKRTRIDKAGVGVSLTFERRCAALYQAEQKLLGQDVERLSPPQPVDAALQNIAGTQGQGIQTPASALPPDLNLNPVAPAGTGNEAQAVTDSQPAAKTEAEKSAESAPAEAKTEVKAEAPAEAPAQAPAESAPKAEESAPAEK